MPRSKPPKPLRLPFLRAAAFAAALLILPGAGVANDTPAPGVIGDEKKPPQPPRTNEPPAEGQGLRPGGDRPPDPPRTNEPPVEGQGLRPGGDRPPDPPRTNEPPVEGQGVRPGGDRPPDPPRVGSAPVEAYLRLMHQRWLHNLRVYDQPR